MGIVVQHRQHQLQEIYNKCWRCSNKKLHIVTWPAQAQAQGNDWSGHDRISQAEL